MKQPRKRRERQKQRTVEISGHPVTLVTADGKKRKIRVPADVEVSSGKR